MSETYNKIDKGICPGCGEKMEYVDAGAFQDRICNFCGIRWHFNDDMGPGSYSAKYIDGGRKWKEDKLYSIACDIDFVAIVCDNNSKLWKAHNLVSDELNKITKELEPNKEKDNA